MRRILGNQSELSFASAIFYFSGGLIAILSVTIFRSDQNPLNLANILTACSALLVAIVFLIAGRRARPEIAILVLCAAALLVLLLSSVSMNELRFVNSGLMFYTFVIYLVWFGPMWLARIFGYTWLACYWVIAIWRFGDHMYSMLVTLTISSAMLGELVGVFSRRLKASSLTDVLCGVWNKRGFQLLLSKAIRTARRGGSRLSMLFLDLDDFKGVNDSLGHAEGDRVLRAFAVQIEAGSRTGDTLARIGGDEFVLLMPETGAEQGDAVARRLQEAVDVVSWSYGVAELLPGEGAEEFISRADQLMLEQKARRRAQRAGGGAADRLSP